MNQYLFLYCSSNSCQFYIYAGAISITESLRSIGITINTDIESTQLDKRVEIVEKQVFISRDRFLWDGNILLEFSDSLEFAFDIFFADIVFVSNHTLLKLRTYFMILNCTSLCLCQATNENLPPNVVKQLAKELKNLDETPPAGIRVSVNDDDFSTIYADIEGPGRYPLFSYIFSF